MSSRLTPRNVLLLIFAALVAWGLLHAIGGYLGGINAPANVRLMSDWRRALVILACVLAFLAGWAALLASRDRNQRR